MRYAAKDQRGDISLEVSHVRRDVQSGEAGRAAVLADWVKIACSMQPITKLTDLAMVADRLSDRTALTFHR